MTLRYKYTRQRCVSADGFPDEIRSFNACEFAGLSRRLSECAAKLFQSAILFTLNKANRHGETRVLLKRFYSLGAYGGGVARPQSVKDLAPRLVLC